MKRIGAGCLLVVLSLQMGCGSNSTAPTTPSGSSGPNYTYPFSQFMGTYNVSGAGPGQFNGPEQIAIYNNALFVVDQSNKRLQKLDLNGNFLGAVTIGGTPNYWGLTIDKFGVIYVGDHGAATFSKYDPNLNSLGTYTPSIAPSAPYNLATDANGKIYFMNHGNDTLERCDNNGSNCVTVGGTGTAVGQLSNPIGVALDGSGNVYVADYYNNRIQKFDPSLASPSVFIGTGTTSGFVTQPIGLATDSDGNVFVSDTPTSVSRVQKFSASGSYLATLTPSGTVTFSGFYDLVGIAVDPSKNVYVSDWQREGVFKFAPF